MRIERKGPAAGRIQEISVKMGRPTRFPISDNEISGCVAFELSDPRLVIVATRRPFFAQHSTIQYKPLCGNDG